MNSDPSVSTYLLGDENLVEMAMTMHYTLDLSLIHI